MLLETLHLAAPGFDNPRKHRGLDPDSILELGCSIIRHGLLSALIVEADGLIIGGQRRYLAICAIREQPDAVLEHARKAFGEDAAAEIAELLPFRARQLAQVPIIIPSAQRDEAALVDNLLREDLTTYEVAGELARMAGDGAGVRAIARRICRDKASVSRLLTAWRQAGPELRSAWQAERIPFTRVRELAELPADAQASELAIEFGEAASGTPRSGRGGTHGRPSIDTIRDILDDYEPIGDYGRGVQDALRYVAGMRPDLPTALDKPEKSP